MGAGRCRNVV